jgi:nucleotidyltransferase DUF2204
LRADQLRGNALLCGDVRRDTIAATCDHQRTSKHIVAEDAPNPSYTSSIPQQLPEKQEGLFREVLSVLESKKIPYAVSGAFALRQHTGISRFTKDLDLFLSPAEVPNALSALREQGFVCDMVDPVWLAKARRDEFFVDLITGMSNALMTVDQSWIDRARPAMIVGVKTRVLAPEELLASKLFVVRRERFDGADIAHIIYGTGGELDWDRVLALVGDHWEMLLWSLILFRYIYPGQTDYVPAGLWQDLLSRFSQLVQNPDPKAPFRGSLVDDNMFAIDVREWGLADLLHGLRERRLEQDRMTTAACQPE